VLAAGLEATAHCVMHGMQACLEAAPSWGCLPRALTHNPTLIHSTAAYSVLSSKPVVKADSAGQWPSVHQHQRHSHGEVSKLTKHRPCNAQHHSHSAFAVIAQCSRVFPWGCICRACDHREHVLV